MPGGRPLKLNPSDRQTIVDAISNGTPKRYAAQKVGITERTLYGMLRRGSDDSNAGKRTAVSEFFHAVKKAEAAAVERLLGQIDDALENGKTWTGYAWKLERMFPASFGPPSARRVETDEFDSGDSPLDRLVSLFEGLRDGVPEEERSS